MKILQNDKNKLETDTGNDYSPAPKGGRTHIKTRKRSGWFVGLCAALVSVGLLAGCGSNEKPDTKVVSSEVQEQTEEKPPTITQEEVTTLFPGYEIVTQQLAHINGSYYTILAIGQHASELDASVKVAVVDYDADSEDMKWNSLWETEEYFADPMFEVENFLGDLFVLEQAEAPIALVGFNVLHGGSMAIYETTILEINDQGIGKVGWEGNGSRIEMKDDSLIAYDLGETHFSIEIDKLVVNEIGRSDLAPEDAYKASFTLKDGLVVPTDSKDIYLELGDTLSFVPEDQEARKNFDDGGIMIYTNLWNGGPTNLANANMLYGGNAIEIDREGTIEFVLDYYTEENPTSFDNPPITFFVHVGEEKQSSESKESTAENKQADDSGKSPEVAAPSESEKSTASSSGISAPFPIGTSLSELTSHYGQPSYDDYYLGGRLVTFDQDGYFIGEQDEVVGYYFANDSLSVFDAKVGMTGEEINSIYGENTEPYFDDFESQTYVHDYAKNGYKIFFHSDEEEGPTKSVIVIKE